jgi:tRNA nucleotidyltransferase (CCA-adding enzyme)
MAKDKDKKVPEAPAKSKEQLAGEVVQQQMLARCKRADEKITAVLKEEGVKIVVSPLQFDNGIIYIAQLAPIEIQRNILEINPPQPDKGADKEATKEEVASGEKSGLDSANE